MSRPLQKLLLAAGVVLVACSPSLNWRDVHPENTRLSLLLPCKPDKAEKPVMLGNAAVELRMSGCDAGGATFAVAVADIGDPAGAANVLAQWQRLTLANMKAELPGAAQPQGGPAGHPAQVSLLKLPGASPQPPPVLVKARGKRADGSEVSGQAAYFAQGSQVFQAVIYSARITDEASETFFSSLRFE